MAERRILNGDRSPVSVLMAQSKKLARVTRSSLGAEVQSGSMAVEEQEFVHLLWTHFEPQGRERRVVEDYGGHGYGLQGPLRQH